MLVFLLPVPSIFCPYHYVFLQIHQIRWFHCLSGNLWWLCESGESVQSRSLSPAKLPSPASSSGHPSVRHAVHTAAQWCLMTARPQGPGGKAIATDSSNIDRTLGSLLALRLVRHSDSPFPAHLLLSSGRLAQTMSHRPPASEKGPGFLPTLFGCSYSYKTAEKQLEFGCPATGHPFIHSFWHHLHKGHLCLLTLSVSL